MSSYKKCIAFLVAIFFIMYSFLANVTVFAAEDYSSIQMATFDGTALTASEDFYSNASSSVSDNVYATPTPISFEDFKFPIGTKISDAISHPTEPVIFAVDSSNSIVYSVNVETGIVKEAYVDGTIERMDFYNGELFVTVLTGSHSSYWWEEDQSGIIAVIDAETMELKEKIDIDIDPYDIVAGRDGYLYVPSGSGQWTFFNSYSRSTKQLAGTASIRQMSFAEYNPALNRIYTIDTDTSPRDFEAFNIDNGKFIDSYDSPYHGDYSLTTNFKISPDGKYIFNGSGNIFTCNKDKAQDMRFCFKLNKSFNDIAFDLDHKLFFTSVGNKLVYVYDYDTLCGIDTVYSKGTISKLFFQDGKLIALSSDGQGQLTLENIQIDNVINNLSTPTPIPTPLQTGISTPIAPTFNQLDLNMEVIDSVVHPDKEFIYIINSSDELVRINFDTGEQKSIQLGYSPKSIAFGNGEIYVGFGSQGMIGIYDADTLQYKDRIMTGYTFLDIAVGHDGYIYTSPDGFGSAVGYVKSFSRETKQEVSKLWLFEIGYLETNPVNNSFVLSSTRVSPTDLYTIKYSNGVITEQYDSRYHGDYSIGIKNRISPDGAYIFNTTGNIFKTSDIKTEDLRFFLKLSKPFTDVAFDLDNDKFYTAVNGNMIYEYKYSTFIGTDTKQTKGTVKDMYYRNGYIIAVSKTADNQTLLEKIKVEDSSLPIENVTPTPTPTAISTLTPSPSQTSVERINLSNYTIKDSVIHDKSPIVYFVDNTNNKLVSMNYMTGEINEIKISYTPTCLDLYNGEIYVGCGQNGIIYIYDEDTFTLKDQIICGTTFGDMGIGDDGFIYILEGRYAISFSRTAKQEISRMYIFYSGRIEKHPTRNAFYFTREGVSPSDIHAFEYDNGKVISTHESPYHGDYSIGNINRISPDGKLIFNSSGNIFSTSANALYDITYVSKLKNGFSDACFDEKTNLLFTVSSNIVNIYDYSTLTHLSSTTIENKPSFMFYKDDRLLLLAQDSLEIITSEELDAIIPTTPTPTSVPGIMLPFNANITDAVEHPEKPVIFAADASNSKVYSVNIETGIVKEAFIDGAIERLDYQDDILYVTVLEGVHSSYWWEEDQSGGIVMIDANTMEIIKKFEIDIDPYDIVGGRDGYIYVPSGSGQWTNFNSYSPVSKQLIGTRGIRQASFAELHPTLNRIYTITTDTSPRDYEAFDIDNGKFTASHDSPYHGDYSLSTNFKISPDGKYLFNGSGVIFSCSEDISNDMKFVFRLNKGYKDIAFNLEDNKFFTAVGDNLIYVYNYEDFSGVDTISSIGKIAKLSCVDGKLCALSKDADGRPMFEVISTEEDVQPQIKYGDINQDGEINAVDFAYFRSYLLEKIGYTLEGEALLAADVDGNGSVNAIDFAYLKKYLLGMISEFPVEQK